MSVECIARGSGYYRVYVDGVEVSQHTTPHKAQERATNEAEANPDAHVRYDHDYEVDVAFVVVSAAPDTTAPTLSSATIPAAGTSITFAFSEPVYFGAGGNSGFAVTMSGGAATLIYSSGEGTSSLVYTTSRVVNSGETGTCAYTQPTNGVEDGAGNDLVTFSGTSVTNNSTATEGGGYTATHYVAPYASVSGATSDWDTTNGTPFASATSISTPCTLGEAMANASAGNVIECAEGVYLGNTTAVAERQHSYFMPSNSGSSGTPIIFYAKYPASENYGTTSVYTELRKQNAYSSVLGTNGQDYIIYDGFFIDEQYVVPSGNSGMTSMFSGSENCEFRRFAFDRYDWGYADDYNANCIYFDQTINFKVLDCYFQGGVTTASHNNAAINIYNSANYLIQNNTFEDTFTGIYSKENGLQPGGTDPNPYRTSGNIQYNKFINCDSPVELQQGITVGVKYNLMTGVNNASASTGAVHFDSGPDRVGTLTWEIEHNTIVLSGGTDTGFHLEDVLAGLTTCKFQDNIVYCGAAQTSGYMVSTRAVEGGSMSNWAWSDFAPINYNCYYAPTTIRWYGNANGDSYTSLSSWQTETSQEANSITSDPEFTNIGTGDYTLAANSQAALTASSTGGPVGCYVTGSEEIGMRADPGY